MPVIIEELHIQILEFATCLQEGDQGRRHHRTLQGFRTLPGDLLHVCVDIVHHLRVHDGALQIWLRRAGRGVQEEGDAVHISNEEFCKAEASQHTFEQPK